jgi:hypothetical protein
MSKMWVGNESDCRYSGLEETKSILRYLVEIGRSPFSGFRIAKYPAHTRYKILTDSILPLYTE